MTRAEMTWADFCDLYYTAAREKARAVLGSRIRQQGGLDLRVDTQYIVDAASLAALEKTYVSYDHGRGTRVTTLLSTVVHNEVVDMLEKESKYAARLSRLDDAAGALKDYIRAERLDVRSDELFDKLRRAVNKLSPSDRVILDYWLTDGRGYVQKAAEKIGISENYVSVRKKRILKHLLSLMKTTKEEYFAWKETREGPVFAGTTVSGKAQIDIFHTKYYNPIDPHVSTSAVCGKLLMIAEADETT